MATGYTDRVSTGKITKFDAFARQCARAFGALVTMRDDDSDAPFPVNGIKGSNYNRQSIPSARKELTRLSTLTDVGIERAMKKDVARESKYHNESIETGRVVRERYQGMLAKVLKWDAPSAEHQGLKKFMVEQLQSSIEHDCNGTYHMEALEKLRNMTPWSWYQAKLEGAAHMLGYHRKEADEEAKRTADRNKWITDLDESLKAFEAMMNPKPAKKARRKK